MKTIYDVDKNFELKSNLGKEDLAVYSVRQDPFRLHGIFWNDGKFRRLPENVAKAASDGVHFLHANTAGGRVRFKTDSPYIYIYAQMGVMNNMSHMALTGSTGFDLYRTSDDGQILVVTFFPPFDIGEKKSFEAVWDIPVAGMNEFTLNFPLYSEVCELYVGIAKDAVLEAPANYSIQRPVVYYGSSITQGGCASRPGTSYQSIISRRLDCDYLNLGFSGSAKAEDAMIDYIRELDMSLFVYDYDHNAPTVEHLAATHEKMFLSIREKHPEIPIILMSRPRVHLVEHEVKRLEIIKRTYQNAVDRGDKNIYFIPGSELMRYCGDDGTVDNCHPTDAGFTSIAKVLGDLMATISFK